MGYGNGLSLVKILDLPSTLIIPLMVLLGILFVLPLWLAIKARMFFPYSSPADVCFADSGDVYCN